MLPEMGRKLQRSGQFSKKPPWIGRSTAIPGGFDLTFPGNSRLYGTFEVNSDGGTVSAQGIWDGGAPTW